MNRALWTSILLGCLASVVLETEPDNIVLRVGIVPVVGLAETSECRAKSLNVPTLVCVPLYLAALGNCMGVVVILLALISKDLDGTSGNRAGDIARENLRPKWRRFEWSKIYLGDSVWPSYSCFRYAVRALLHRLAAAYTPLLTGRLVSPLINLAVMQVTWTDNF